MSAGELIDKITILEIKAERIADPAKRANVVRELTALAQLRDIHALSVGFEDLTVEIKSVNEALWEIEDALRELETEKRFDERFVELARAVYVTNDRRAAIKKEINVRSGSLIVEEKSYAGT
ncbi:MAG: hypothetical protein B7Y61_08410 [Rhizobiales bacterium 35-66-30]|nr:MAG: hypothetical protein B7Y61_08410 [Rhizobiales bacterium 35-66-30]OZB01169.1 MAG: hypothetical protein B7X67_20450 [Rhizobiales bacterium 39-66-18]